MVKVPENISKRLVEIMNGHISLQSTIGQGSVFEITLEEIPVLAIAPVVENNHEVKNLFFEPAQVLVVDDIKSNRKLIKEGLSQVGLEVFEAENGQKALLFAKKYQPDLILMDIRMPIMDGYEATSILKKNPSTRKIPIIALTATVLLKEQSQFQNLGFEGYLLKPIQIASLLNELSHYLKHKVVEPITKNTCLEIEISPHSKILPEVREKLETFLPKWETLQGALDIDEIEKFASNIKKLGKKYQISYITTYGDNLYEFTQAFEIEQIENTLNQFPKLVDKLV